MKYALPISFLLVGVAGFVYRLFFPRAITVGPMGSYGCPVAIGVGLVLIYIVWSDDRPR